MRVVIVGGGEVGSHLAERLSALGWDLVLLEADSAAKTRAEALLDVLTVHGSGIEPEDLERAGIRETDVFISVTSRDEVNLLACQLARYYGVPERIARVNSEGLSQESLGLAEHMGINLFIGNDLVGCWNATVDDRQLRSWFDRSQVFLFFMPERLKKIAEQNKELAALRKKIVEPQGEQNEAIIKGDVDVLTAAFPWIVDPALEEAAFSEQEFADVEAARAFDLLVETRRNYYEALFNVLAKIQRAAHGTILMVVMIPDEFQVNEKLWKQVLARLMKKDVDRFKPQQRISEWLGERDIHCLDLLKFRDSSIADMISCSVLEESMIDLPSDSKRISLAFPASIFLSRDMASTIS